MNQWDDATCQLIKVNSHHSVQMAVNFVSWKTAKFLLRGFFQISAMTKVPATACIPVPTWITHQDCQVFFCLFLEIGCDLGICRRIGNWACRRIGIWACRRIGIWACRRIGIWACRRIGIWACRRIGIWACRRIGIWACRRIGICCGCDFYPKPWFFQGFGEQNQAQSYGNWGLP